MEIAAAGGVPHAVEYYGPFDSLCLEKDMNKCMFAGRLVRDPKLNVTKTGKHVVKFCLAIDRRYKDKNDQWQSDPSFPEFEAWDDGADTIMERYKKGDFMLIDDASLKTDHWTKEVDGKEVKMERLSFRCNHFVLLPILNSPPKKKEGEEAEAEPAQAPAGKSGKNKAKTEEEKPQEDTTGPDGPEEDIPF